MPSWLDTQLFLKESVSIPDRILKSSDLGGLKEAKKENSKSYP